MDGVVCGHIHQPEIRMINGVKYCNDGDWVESLSALVETMDGELKLIHWTDAAANTNANTNANAIIKPRPIAQPQLEPAAAE